MREQRVSYSALSDLDQCTMKYYMGRILGLPQKVWPKTVMGSLTHAILESLANPRHRHHYDRITASGRAVYTESAAIRRLVDRWRARHAIPDNLIDELDEMLTVALVKTDFFYRDAVKVYPPEHEFIVVHRGARLKGFIDSMADMGDYMLIRDWKTAGQKASKREAEESYQTWMYQWYVRRAFGKPAVVEYVYLRHGPTTRTPEKHIIRVPPGTAEQEDGFAAYAAAMYPVMNSFGLAEAHSGFCRDEGFCLRVCSYKVPTAYYAVVDRTTGETISTHMLDNRPQIDDNTRYIEERRHSGCPRYNPQ